MNEYKVYFEIFGKKMVTTIWADSREKAKEIVRSKIIFHKIDNKDDTLDNLMNIFGLKK